jgi:hypothetical protein
MASTSLGPAFNTLRRIASLVALVTREWTVLLLAEPSIDFFVTLERLWNNL